MDELEPRALLSTTPWAAHPTFVVRSFAGGGPPSSAFTPAQIANAYGFSSISFGSVAGNGAGQTIAIVDAYDDPNIQTDLNTFDSQFKLPAVTVARVDENGGTNYPASDSTGGWELEESLDVEWAHAMAPGAKILLVEAASTNYSDLFTAVGYAASQANVVSMSWGGSELSDEAAYDSQYFDQPGVAYVASSGDTGAPASYPSASPNVLSVGGTSLYLGAGNTWSSEVGWSGSGGGPSAYESQPAYQNGVVTKTQTARATPDVAYDASPNTGVAVSDSFPYQGTNYGWVQVGGTSAGAPQWSALLAVADQGRSLSAQPALDSTSPQEVQNLLYANPASFHDITTGTSTGSPSYSAGPAYDYVTGMGSPIANLVVASLDGNPTTAPTAPDTLVLSAPTAETSGMPFRVTVTALAASGKTDTGYTGSIHFTSTDPQASLPADFTFTSADSGTFTFTVTLNTAGTQSIAATDAANSAVTGTLSGISVAPSSAAGSIWGNSYVPSENSYSFGSYELGLKFTASESGEVTGARFYKESWMRGYTHVGKLWSSTGSILATATFTNESAFGWQQVNFARPVAIAANTVYIVSFSTGGGYYGITNRFFNLGGVTSGPLEALPNSVAGGNGVYNRAGRFPNVNGNGMNFWADVAFTLSAPPLVRVVGVVPPSRPSNSGIAGVSSTVNPSNSFATTLPATTSAGPGFHTAGWRGTVLPIPGYTYRRAVSPVATVAPLYKKPSFT
jgi:subtilase family serine protease